MKAALPLPAWPVTYVPLIAAAHETPTRVLIVFLLVGEKLLWDTAALSDCAPIHGQGGRQRRSSAEQRRADCIRADAAEPDGPCHFSFDLY